ncbi:hypothetical protein MMPV_005015 [Pyropia vietnamensis]
MAATAFVPAAGTFVSASPGVGRRPVGVTSGNFVGARPLRAVARRLPRGAAATATRWRAAATPPDGGGEPQRPTNGVVPPRADGPASGDNIDDKPIPSVGQALVEALPSQLSGRLRGLVGLAPPSGLEDDAPGMADSRRGGRRFRFRRKSEPKEDPRDESARQDIGRVCRLFLRLALPYFRTEPSAKWYLGGVVALTLLQSGVSVAFSYIMRDLWSGLSNRDIALFYHQVQLFFGATLVATPIVVAYGYSRDLLALEWRKWMTESVTSDYFAHRNYYALESAGMGGLDNPDQRLTQDVASFTHESLTFLLTLLLSVVDLASFSTILWSIYPQLFGVLIVYSAAGTLASVAIGKRLVNLNFVALSREADLRYSLVRLRENAESVAFYGGEEREGAEIARRLDSVVENRASLIAGERNLSALTTAYHYLIQALPSLVVAPLYFAGSIQLGVVTQSYSAFNHVLRDLSLLVTRFDALSAFGAGVNRLGEIVAFMERDMDENERTFLKNSADLNDLLVKSAAVSTPSPVLPATASDGHAADANVSEGHSAVANGVVVDVANGVVANGAVGNGAVANGAVGNGAVANGAVGNGAVANGVAQPIHRDSEIVMNLEAAQPVGLIMEKVCLFTPAPSSRLLVSDLTLDAPPGSRLLIAGASGTGKSSLLRAIAGLWRTGSGTVTRDTPAFFLPQRPYCTLGSLREQLTYPADVEAASALSDEELLSTLERVSLGDLAARSGGLEAVVDWGDVLSLGEQQRLGFGRLLVATAADDGPRLAILDESTSALDLATEEKMYGALAAAGVTVVSVGHRPSLLRYHDRILRVLGKEGSWRLEEVDTDAVAKDLSLLQVL